MIILGSGMAVLILRFRRSFIVWCICFILISDYYTSLINGFLDALIGDGPCPRNDEESTFLSPEATSIPFLDGSSRILNLQAPYCIAATIAGISTNGTLFAARESNPINSPITHSLMVTTDGIEFVVGGITNTIDAPGIFDASFQHVQICVDTDGTLILYSNCSEVTRTTIVPIPISDTAIISFFREDVFGILPGNNPFNVRLPTRNIIIVKACS